MKTLLDTSVVIGPSPGPMPGEIAISAVTLAELHFGVLVAKTPDARAHRLLRLSSVERRFRALPVDERVAQEYGRLAAAVAALGRQPRARSLDLLIAATASVNEASLMTRNPGDLVGLESHLEIIAVA